MQELSAYPFPKGLCHKAGVFYTDHPAITNNNLYTFDLYTYFKSWGESPINLILGIFDILIVLFLLYKGIKFFRKTRAWQLLKGIAILVAITLISGWIKLGILNAILTAIMTYRGNYSNCCICSRT